MSEQGFSGKRRRASSASPIASSTIGRAPTCSALAGRRQRQWQPPPVQLPGPARAAGHQEPARRRDQAGVGPPAPSTYMREHMDTDIAAAHLVISGNDVMLCDGDQLIDV